jgi:hypothetical protein
MICSSVTAVEVSSPISISQFLESCREIIFTCEMADKELAQANWKKNICKTTLRLCALGNRAGYRVVARDFGTVARSGAPIWERGFPLLTVFRVK